MVIKSLSFRRIYEVFIMCMKIKRGKFTVKISGVVKNKDRRK